MALLFDILNGQVFLAHTNLRLCSIFSPAESSKEGEGITSAPIGGVAPLLIPYSPSIADPFDSAGQDADAPGKSVGKG